MSDRGGTCFEMRLKGGSAEGFERSFRDARLASFTLGSVDG